MSEAQKKYSVEFVCSAAHFKELPAPTGDEYAVLGRSNVGKSTFINHSLACGTPARVSKKPGKTTLANLYRLDDGLFWVDLPGYGYAEASIAEKERWGKLIAEYCGKRDNLDGIIWLLDIRHPGAKADMEANEWLAGLGRRVLPVLTKGDKLSRSQRKKQVDEFRKIFEFTDDPIIYSSLEHGSRGRFWDRFYAWRKDRR
ncbi:MAG: ribosome biogenesis GTP-binding protein YihA/YsxC [Chitinispirillales bacterium]|jgi:GTP-binding protein|nr:ribosome biogenesis GTP-binding protein YihA/YsxC [Chitinispirillales bacterium]